MRDAFEFIVVAVHDHRIVCFVVLAAVLVKENYFLATAGDLHGLNLYFVQRDQPTLRCILEIVRTIYFGLSLLGKLFVDIHRAIGLLDTSSL